jgi:hypothetical protein
MSNQRFVPVLDSNNRLLMPTKSQRAARWVQSGKATPFWQKNIWCVRLNVDPSSRNLQPIAIGVDLRSKRKDFTVKSQAHTYLNLQSHAIVMVVEFGKTPCRAAKKNHDRDSLLPPPTRARWQAKLRIIRFLMQLYPVTHLAVEDIKAKIWRGSKKRKQAFSSLEMSKQWFYVECRKLAILEVFDLEVFDGYEHTDQTCQQLRLKKLVLDLSTFWTSREQF